MGIQPIFVWFTRVTLLPAVPLFRRLAGLWSITGIILGFCPVAIAQIVPDGSVSTTVTSSDSVNFEIGGGDRAGNNLFHSFDQFSIPTGGSARFNNSSRIDTIISRVTGGQASIIDGLIQSNGTADVFLMNSSGFVFGENARLDIGGSLIATTADSLVFDDTIEFRATDPMTPPLLSVHTPVGLQMGTNPGPIRLEGPGHTLAQPNDFAPVLNSGNQSGLGVSPGQTIGLIGGRLNFTGASIAAAGGQIQLGSVRQGFVGIHQTQDQLGKGPLTRWQFDYDQVEAFGDIWLSQRSLLQVSGGPAGGVEVWGDRVRLEDGSIILSQNSGPLPARDITLNANTRLTIAGMATGNRFRSSIHSITHPDSVAQSSSINIQTPRLTIKDRGAIIAATYGLGAAGDVNINATERLAILGGVANESLGDVLDSTIGTVTVGNNGSAGRINIQSPRLTLVSGSINTSTIDGDGTGGDIRINADTITLSGASFLDFLGISAATLGQGDGGNVEINTRILNIQEGNIVGASSLASGRAGDVTIAASDRITIGGQFGGQLAPNMSLISSTVVAPSGELQQLLGIGPIPTGQAGQIILKMPRLQIGNQGSIVTLAQGGGTAGSVEVYANQVNLVDGGSILATHDNNADGNIRIFTDVLRIDNGLINASSFQSGRGGDITIQADERIVMTGQGIQSLGQNVILPAFEGTFSGENVTQGIAAIALRQGDAGTIDIQTRDLRLSDGSLIAAVTFGDGSGGNIRIRGDRRIALDRSVITTSTLNLGRAGNMNVQTAELLLQNGSLLAVSTEGTGQAGSLVVQASEQAIFDGSLEVETLTFASGLAAGNLNNAIGNGGDISLTTPLLIIRNGAELSVSAFADGPNGGLGPNPDEFQAGTIRANIGTLILDNGNITALSTQGEGGNIVLDIGDRLLLQNQSTISTQAGTEASGGGNGGNIDLTTPFIVARNNSDIVANAFEGMGGNIQITTQGLFGIQFREDLTPASDITASSTFGVSGTVTIQTPEIEPASETTQLPSTPTNHSQPVATGCEQTSGSQFIITGRGGGPLSPSMSRPWPSLLEDLGTAPEPVPERGNGPSSIPDQTAPSLVREATQMAIAPNGTIRLISASPWSNPTERIGTCS